MRGKHAACRRPWMGPLVLVAAMLAIGGCKFNAEFPEGSVVFNSNGLYVDVDDAGHPGSVVFDGPLVHVRVDN